MPHLPESVVFCRHRGRRRCRLVPARQLWLPILIGAAFLAGCGHNPGTPVDDPPARIIVLAGADQTAVAGAELVSPQIRVVDADSRAVPGITVHWTITAGDGTVEPASSVTDGIGRAQARWTLGSTVGGHVLRIAVAGVEPVLLQAHATAGAPVSLEKVLGDGQVAKVATRLPLSPTIVLRDALGNPCPNIVVWFHVAAGGGWAADIFLRSDANGRVRATWYLGPTPGVTNVLRVTCGELVTEFTAEALALLPGDVLYGRNEYIEYVVGDLPLVLSFPHGGYLFPADIEDRTWGTSGRDINTQETARAISDAFAERFGGGRPHVIICHLARIKLDANREILEAAQGHRYSEWAWYEYHRFIDAAEAAVEAACGRGFYIDLHGHSHPIARLELGYLLGGTNLEQPDAVLDGSYYVDKCSIRNLALTSPLTLSELVRGPSSLGTYLETAGIPACPSTPQPDPAGEPFYSAGYNIERHGSRDGGVVDGVQIEMHYPGIRDTAANRQAFGRILAEVMEDYLAVHYDLVLSFSAGASASLPVPLFVGAHTRW
jgi:hypothetical protein